MSPHKNNEGRGALEGKGALDLEGNTCAMANHNREVMAH
jgi:hypothetical protein